MKRKCTIFYGLSGSLKMATLNSSLYENDFKVYSDTKPFYGMDERYFNWSSRPNDAHLAIHRILTLQLPGYLPDDKDVVIERGVTDNAFCIPNRKIQGMDCYDLIDIDGLVDLESKALSKYDVSRKLLIMRDENFIINEVLKDRYRRTLYPDLSTYLEKQDDYVRFTRKYNDIDEEVVIADAKDYITRILKLNWHGSN